VQQAQDYKYDGDDDQNMDPTAGFRKSWADPATEKAQQPQYDQYYDNYPQHEVSPFEWSLGTTRR
jgi:hypothetical protein